MLRIVLILVKMSMVSITGDFIVYRSDNEESQLGISTGGYFVNRVSPTKSILLEVDLIYSLKNMYQLQIHLFQMSIFSYRNLTRIYHHSILKE